MVQPWTISIPFSPFVPFLPFKYYLWKKNSMFHIIWQFIKFYFVATTKYRIHSPFVFDFIKNVLEDNRLFYAYHEVETVRKRLLNNTQEIEVTDLGAGSKFAKDNKRSIRQIAKTALSSPSFCRLLFKLTNYYKPDTILEMGTSLGISTAYLRKGALNARLLSLEGCPQIAAQAQKVFKGLKLKNMETEVGDFSSTLPKSLQTLGSLDLVFFDGNHRKTPTLQYFNKAFEFATDNSVFVFDDIYWSKEMIEAWDILKADERVTLSIDLFSMGILFFKKDFKAKKHYKLVKWWWKPWIMGFFR
ncbi:MAG: putative O-methyltransferase YrrM [Saprospiraceae bacterium]|jgi:predicted O-methyltransferase YrrM